VKLVAVRLECPKFTSNTEKEMEMQELHSKWSCCMHMQLCWLLNLLTCRERVWPNSTHKTVPIVW